MSEVVTVAAWPAARDAGALLTALGLDVNVDATTATAITGPLATVAATPSSIAQDWWESGAMPVTGFPDGPALQPVGRPATIAKAASLALQYLTGTPTPGAALLGERAAIMGLRRHGQTSAGGGTRLLRAADGWWAFNLARDTDLDLVPALVEAEVGGDPWLILTEWAATRSVADIVDRTRLLGLAAAALGETTPPPSPWRITTYGADAPLGGRVPVVMNLGALWAGPLTGRLLADTGAAVIDIESSTRPDPSRQLSPHFYDLLHRGHESRTLDFAQPGLLQRTLEQANVVIEASRPRALAALGLHPEALLTTARPRIWLRITGHRDPTRVAFGDDAAVAGGLVAWDDQQPVFAGDAIADPLTGVLATLAVTSCLRTPGNHLIELAMADVATYCARPAV